MVPLQRATAATQSYEPISPDIAQVAQRYQQLKEIEKAHLAIMAQHNLLGEWSPEVRATVLEARAHIREACAARQTFREKIAAFVREQKRAGYPLPSTLRQTRSMLQSLEVAGVLHCDEGWLEAEVLEWAIEIYETE
jgi:hypothetical protein